LDQADLGKGTGRAGSQSRTKEQNDALEKQVPDPKAGRLVIRMRATQSSRLGQQSDQFEAQP
jgi:hypothetical protein